MGQMKVQEMAQHSVLGRTQPGYPHGQAMGLNIQGSLKAGVQGGLFWEVKQVWKPILALPVRSCVRGWVTWHLRVGSCLQGMVVMTPPSGGGELSPRAGMSCSNTKRGEEVV